MENLLQVRFTDDQVTYAKSLETITLRNIPRKFKRSKQGKNSRQLSTLSVAWEKSGSLGSTFLLAKFLLRLRRNHTESNRARKTLDLRTPRDRIWFGMLNAKRMSLYCAKRSGQLELRYKVITFFVALIPVVALGLLLSELSLPVWIVPTTLFCAGLCEIALIHFGLGSDTKAAKIIANQTTEIARQRRQLWIDQDRDDIELWIAALESQEIAITTEAIPYRENVSRECAKEAKRVLALQFGS